MPKNNEPQIRIIDDQGIPVVDRDGKTVGRAFLERDQNGDWTMRVDKENEDGQQEDK